MGATEPILYCILRGAHIVPLRPQSPGGWGAEQGCLGADSTREDGNARHADPSASSGVTLYVVSLDSEGCSAVPHTPHTLRTFLGTPLSRNQPLGEVQTELVLILAVCLWSAASG